MKNKQMKVIGNKMKSVLDTILETQGELDNFLEEVKNGKKYLICLDMGCGGTSAAIYLIGTDEIPKLIDSWESRKPKNARSQSLTEIVDRISKNSQLCLPTIIGYRGTRIVVGPDAVKTSWAVENFKDLPDDKNLGREILKISDRNNNEMWMTLEDVWRDYFQCVLGIIFYQAQANCEFTDCNIDNSILVVAHPASELWSYKEILANYKKLISEATGFYESQILTISEAKAAMQYVEKIKFQNDENQNNKKLDYGKGVLIIDLGASTIDIEYISKENPQPKEYSLKLAGKEIDYILAYDILCKNFPGFKKNSFNPNSFSLQYNSEQGKEELKVLEEFIRDNLCMTRAEFMFQIRMLKERICDSEGVETLDASEFIKHSREKVKYVSEFKNGIIEDSNLVSLKDLISRTNLVIECDPFFAHYINEEKGSDDFPNQMISKNWYEFLRGFISYVLDDLNRENLKVGEIVVTGGTSRLVGIQSCIKDGILHSKIKNQYTLEKHIHMLTAPLDYERTVPFGSAYYIGNTLKNIDKMLEFPKVLQQILDETFVETLTEQITLKLNDYIHPIVEQALKEWSELSKKHQDADLEGLDKILSKKMSNLALDQIKKCIDNGVGNLNKTQENCLNKVYKEIKVFLEKLANGTYSHKIDLSKIKINVEVTNLSNAIKNSIRNSDLKELKAGFLNWFRSIKNQKVRQQISENFTGSSQDHIKDDIKKVVKKEVENMYKETNRFGLEEQIITGIVDDIARAMYLSDSNS